MAAHALLSPSSAHRWMNCPGSVAAEKGLPDEETRWAAEGTVAHDVFELALKFGIEPHWLIGQKRRIGQFNIEIIAEMADYLLPIIDEIEGIGGQQFYEMQLRLDKWLPAQWGTLDVGILTDDWVIIADLKYGQGVPVHPEGNEQLLIYLLAFCAWLNVQGVKIGNRRLKIIIYQPRCPGGGGEWEISFNDLIEFGKKVRRAGRAAMKPNAPLVPGRKTCQWCKAAKTNPPCAAYSKFNLDLLGLEKLGPEDSIEMTSPENMRPEHRAVILKHQPMIEAWLATLHQNALDDALAGRPTPGMKAVYGRAPHRKWKNEIAARTFLDGLGVHPFKPPETISPAEAEDALKQLTPARTKEGKAKRAATMGKLDNHVQHGDPKPILVADSDKREAITVARHEFEDLGAEDA